MNSKIISFLRYYLPAIVWAAFIFLFSSLPDLKIGAASVSAEVVLRKLAHLAEYGVFSWLMFRIFYQERYFDFKSAAVLSLSSTILFAISDEMHQLYVTDRAGRIIDVIVDVLGGLLTIEVISFFAGSKAYLRRAEI